eukprot:gene31916-39432_t
MTNELSCPITAKVRLLPSLDDSIALCQAIESCGVSLLTVHGRTATQNKQHCGEASWDAICAIKQSLSIPVVANGGIDSLAAAQHCLAATSADAVMSSEALLENPKMFSVQVHGNKLPIELAARSKTNQHAMDLLDIIEDTVCKVDYNHERAVAEGLVGET